MARAGIGPIIADRVKPKAVVTPPRQSTAISADAAERRINAARDKAIAEVRKSPTSADAADRKIQNAVNREVAKITGKPVPKTTTSPAKPPTTTINRPKSTTVNNSPPATTGDPGNQSNSGNEGDSGSGGSQSATPPSFESSSGSSVSATESVVPPVKSAPIDTVVFNDESFAEEFLIDILFEDVVGQELLTLARGETVNGQEVIYQPIKNLGLLQNIYNPNNILGLTETSASFFASFVINLNEKIPTKADPNTGKNYYVDPANGDIVIELVSLQSDEQVDFQIATSGTIDRLGI